MYFGCKLQYSKSKNLNPEESLPQSRQCKSSSKMQLHLSRETQFVTYGLGVMWLDPKWVLGSSYFCANKNAKKLWSSLLISSLSPKVLVTTTSSPRKYWFHTFLGLHFPSFHATETPPHQYKPFNMCRYPHIRKWWIQTIYMPLYNTRLWQAYLQL